MTKTQGENADKWAKMKYSGAQPIHKAAAFNNVRILELLVNEGVSVDEPNLRKPPSKPLHYAAQHDSLEAVEFLIAHDANVDARGENNNTPLTWATSENSTRAVKSLIMACANVELANKWKNARELAEEKKLTKIIKMLDDKSLRKNCHDEQ